MRRLPTDVVVLARHGPLPLGVRLRVALEILVTYVEVRRRMRDVDVRTVVAGLRANHPQTRAGVEAHRIGRRLATPVRRTLDPLPWDSRCLMRSLTLLAMLARRGVATTLLIGVDREGGFTAHAWIEHEGYPLLPTLGYAPLTVL